MHTKNNCGKERVVLLFGSVFKIFFNVFGAKYAFNICLDSQYFSPDKERLQHDAGIAYWGFTY